MCMTASLHFLTPKSPIRTKRDTADNWIRALVSIFILCNCQHITQFSISLSGKKSGPVTIRFESFPFVLSKRFCMHAKNARHNVHNCLYKNVICAFRRKCFAWLRAWNDLIGCFNEGVGAVVPVNVPNQENSVNYSYYGQIDKTDMVQHYI